jgi:hypothetical protein
VFWSEINDLYEIYLGKEGKNTIFWKNVNEVNLGEKKVLLMLDLAAQVF